MIAMPWNPADEFISPDPDASEAVAVKPLEWREAAWRGGDRMIPYRWTGSVAGTGIYYAVRRDEGVPDLFIVSGWAGVGTNPYHTLEAAKAAAQADYEARIRSALVASPPAPTRGEVLDEILGIVKDVRNDAKNSPWAWACNSIEERINALKGAAEMSDIVAWVLTRDCDPTFPRAYGSKEAALKAMAPMNVGPLPVLHEVPSATLRHKLEEAESRISALTWEDAGEPVKWKDIRRAFIRALKGAAK